MCLELTLRVHEQTVPHKLQLVTPRSLSLPADDNTIGRLLLILDVGANANRWRRATVQCCYPLRELRQVGSELSLLFTEVTLQFVDLPLKQVNEAPDAVKL